MQSEPPVADPFACHRPEWPVPAISGNAGLPAPQTGGHWNHFAEGDRVLVFGPPDPANGHRRVRRGTVLAPPSAGTIKIDFGNEGHEELSAADPVHVSHPAGACRCVVAIP